MVQMQALGKLPCVHILLTPDAQPSGNTSTLAGLRVMRPLSPVALVCALSLASRFLQVLQCALTCCRAGIIPIFGTGYPGLSR